MKSGRCRQRGGGGRSRSPQGERGLKLIESTNDMKNFASLSARRAWIEIAHPARMCILRPCRSPQGERGLKSAQTRRKSPSGRCRSPQGERGLKFFRAQLQFQLPRRSPQGERGLKSGKMKKVPALCAGRSPQGERGLKLASVGQFRAQHTSLTARRAWIEIGRYTPRVQWQPGRSPQGERGLKSWPVQIYRKDRQVALRKESVD